MHSPGLLGLSYMLTACLSPGLRSQWGGRPVGGPTSPTSLLQREAQPLRLSATVGKAGLPPSLWEVP